MERNFFTDLPSEITIGILSRLPIRSIAFCKCVCKPWLDLLDSDDFHKSEIKTPPALALLTSKGRDLNRCMIFEVEDEDEDEVDVEKSHDLHYIRLVDIDIPHGNSEYMTGMAANGLLLLYSWYGHSQIPLYICNPITRQYIELSCPVEYRLDDVLLNFGFGMSKISGKYKVVCIKNSRHHVYTLGTGTWRLVEAGSASGLGIYADGHIVYNGNLHWIGGNDSVHTVCICCFDLENECFSIFSAPPPIDGRGRLTGELSSLRDCLCYSDADICDYEIVIWLMKEYQVEESWIILYKMSSNCFDWIEMGVEPIKLFKDGEVLMLLDKNRLIYYSNKTGTIQQVDMFKDAPFGFLTALIFTPSLSSLTNFEFEDVISF